MSMTPEGKVKQAVKNVLKSFGQQVYWEMPVPGGYGRTGLDIHGCVASRFFAIETKRPTGKLTARQHRVVHMMRKAGATVWIIDSDAHVRQLELWLNSQLAATTTTTGSFP